MLRLPPCFGSSYFYPRPPRGGRPAPSLLLNSFPVFLSTPSARRATLALLSSCRRNANFYPRPPRGGRRLHLCSIKVSRQISIHALREEGDEYQTSTYQAVKNFYPRPPRGGRQPPTYFDKLFDLISIHALREEGDRLRGFGLHPFHYFYPRPPRGGRQQKQRENPLLLSHYTPLCTNCKEMLAKQTAKSHRYLRKRLIFRCEASRKTMCAAGSHWPGIKRSARCLVQTPGAVQRARPSSDSCCPAGRTVDCPRQGRSGRSALL